MPQILKALFALAKAAIPFAVASGAISQQEADLFVEAVTELAAVFAKAPAGGGA